MEIDDFQLVELVKKHNVIYDKNNGQHKSKHARSQAFKQIGIILQTPADICESRWCLLRNRFCLELRHLRNPVASSQPKRPWPLFDAMKFLTKFIYPRKTRSMLLGCKPSYSQYYSDKSENDSFELDSKEPPEEIETTPSLSVDDNTNDSRDHVIEEIRDIEEIRNFPMVTAMEEDDEDILFGKMISKYLKRIKKVDKKIQLKIDIMSLFKTGQLDNV